MKKIAFLLIAALFCGTLSVYAQQDDDFFAPPDYRQIQRNIQEVPSSFYYPRLMSRFEAGDPTMSREEMRHLYFGFVFQPEFVSFDVSQYNRSLADVLRNESLSDADIARVSRYAQALLAEDPFNLRALSALLFVHVHNEDMTEYARIAWQQHFVQIAIGSTGDGMTPDTPFFVIRTAHQYDMLPFLGFQFSGRSRTFRTGNIFSRNRQIINVLYVFPNIFGVERMYFNITPTTRRM